MIDKLEAQSLVAERLAYLEKLRQYKYEAGILELTAMANARIFRASIAGSNCAIFYLFTISIVQKMVHEEFVRRFKGSNYEVYSNGSEYFQVVKICWQNEPAEVSIKQSTNEEVQK